MKLKPEQEADLYLKNYGIKYVREYKFHSTRKFRFDFAIPKYKIAIEIEGGTWVKGRHTRGKGYANDCIKYNEAVKFGWRVLRYTTDQIGEKIIDDIKVILKRDVLI